MKKLVSMLAVVLFAATTQLAAEIWRSSHTSTNESATTLTTGGTHLHKVIVSSAGAASGLVVYNTKDSIDVGRIAAGIDTTSVGEYKFDIWLSSGLMYDTYGTSAASVELLYWTGLRGLDVYQSSFTKTADSNAQLVNGAGVLHKIIIASATAAGTGVDLHNAKDPDGDAQNNRIIRAQGDSTLDQTYDIFFSSGLLRNQTGTAGVTVIYKRGVPSR